MFSTYILKHCGYLARDVEHAKHHEKFGEKTGKEWF